jgi:hypothetical protein
MEVATLFATTNIPIINALRTFVVLMLIAERQPNLTMEKRSI